MQKWYRSREFLLGLFFLGVTILVQRIPNYIGIPLGLLLVCAAAWNLWGFSSNRSRKVIPRPPLKKVFPWAIALVVVVAVCIATLAFLAQPQDGVVAPESPEDGVVVPESPEDGVTPPESTEVWLWSHPSPQEIFDDIDALQPYLQETARQNYEGLSVTWGVTLSSVTDRPDGVRIQAIPLCVGWPRPSVFFTIDVSLYPEIKTMPSGQEFVVQGTITEVTSLWIELGDCQLIFD